MTDTSNNSQCNMREMLVSYLYDEATPEETRRVESHLTECAQCNDEITAFGRVRDMLQQWELSDLPVVRIAVQQKRSAIEVMKELIGVMPVWVKALTAVAAAMLILSVLGTEVSFGNGGFNLKTSLFRSGGAVGASGARLQTRAEEALDRAEVRNIVNQMIADSERQRQTELNGQLVKLQSELNGLHSSDLGKLSARLQEQRDRLRALERDVDRRDGLDLTDILFSDSRGNKTAAVGSESGAEQ